MLPVGIGASAGALASIAAILSGLPTCFSSPIVVGQHTPSDVSSSVADYLARHAPYDIIEVEQRSSLESGLCFVPPPGRHVRINADTDGFVVETLRAPRRTISPSVDIMLESLAECFGSGSIAVILSGMGHDGLAGCRKIREKGGRVIVQDEESSAIWGMPGTVARAGLADAILPLSSIPGALVAATRGARQWRAA